MYPNSHDKQPYRITVWDKYEGKVTLQVWAYSLEDAEDEGYIAAAERGCTMVEELEAAVISND